MIYGYHLEKQSVNHQIPKEGEGGSGQKNQEKKITENYPNLGREFHIQVHRAIRLPKNLKPKQSSSSYIKIKLFEIKARIEF